jgi:acetyl-CoA carboxylase biotin carboxyl carrier protein
MPLQADRDWVVELAREFSNSGWKIVEIRTPEVSITLSDGSAPGASLNALPSPTTLHPGVQGEAGASSAPSATTNTPLVSAAQVPDSLETGSDTLPAVNTVTVNSPGVGTFWNRPKPSEPPFTEVGSHVQAGDTVGLLEVMKMFTEIKADQGGTVVETLADGSFVEFGATVATLALEAS